ncbi:MAG: response regulator [Fibrobacterota bacterium]
MASTNHVVRGLNGLVQKKNAEDILPFLRESLSDESQPFLEEIDYWPLLYLLSEADQLQLLKIVSAHISAVVQLFNSPYGEVRIAVVDSIVAGETEDAPGLLRDLIGEDPELDLYIVKKIADEGTDRSFSVLVDLLDTNHVSVRDYVKTQVKKYLNKHSYPILFNSLLSSLDKANRAIPILDIISDKGIVQAEPFVRQVTQTCVQDVNIRALAVKTLWKIGSDANTALFIDALFDTHDDVAFSIAANLSDLKKGWLKAGILRMIHSNVYDNHRLAEVLLFSEQEKVITELMTASDIFTEAIKNLLESPGMGYYQEKYAPFFDTPLVPGSRSTNPRGLLWAIDDEDFILKKYTRMAVKNGYPLRVFTRPAEAIAQLDTEDPDIVFVDMNMPEMNGVELTHAMMKQKNITAVLVTAQEDVIEDRDIEEGLFCEIIQKPFNEDEFAAVLRRQIGVKRQTTQTGE